MANKTLDNAKNMKKDEFYTQLTDIEKEMRYYKKHFKDKTILCNCDDPFESNFFKYFVLNFNRLKLKKLIATCYSGSPIANQQLSIFDINKDSEENANKPYKAVVTTVYDKTGNGGIDMADIVELFKSGENELTELEGNGDFRSQECLDLLEEADIVVTNPPFSLFREYVATLMKYNKKFIIIGHQNAITYKEIFPLLKNNKMWLGNGFAGNVGFFKSPYKDKAVSSQHKEGMIRVSGVMWFTNLDIKKRHEKLILVKRYNPENYPKYDNYDAINVNKTADIPCDYAGVMGVPITFMNKYSPEQFEIIGLAPERLSPNEASLQNKRYINAIQHKKDGTTCSGNKVNDGPTLLHDTIPAKFPYYTSETVPNKYLEVLYARILIRNKHPEQPKEG